MHETHTYVELSWDPRPVVAAGRCAGATWHHQAHDLCTLGETEFTPSACRQSRRRSQRIGAPQVRRQTSGTDPEASA